MKLKLISWNINGLNASINKGLWSKLKQLDPDMFFLQETKTTEEKIQNLLKKESNTAITNKIQEQNLFFNEINAKISHQNNDINFIDKYNFIWQNATIKKGYSGVASFWKKDLLIKETKNQLDDEYFDIEGRFNLLKFNFQGKNLFIINSYYPQGGRGEHRIEYKIQFYKRIFEITKKLKQDKNNYLILTGDFNTTVGDIDLARPKENKKTTGCLPEEREALNWFLNGNFIDSFRYFYPDLKDKYTYWDQITRARSRNVGWRIDYFLVDKYLEKNLVKAEILDEIYGSDHCPISLEIVL